MPNFQMPEWDWIPNAVQRLVLWVEPAGGQAVARRNAWASLVEDNRRRIERVEADRAAERAVAERPRTDQRRSVAVV